MIQQQKKLKIYVSEFDKKKNSSKIFFDKKKNHIKKVIKKKQSVFSYDGFCETRFVNDEMVALGAEYMFFMIYVETRFVTRTKK